TTDPARPEHRSGSHRHRSLTDRSGRGEQMNAPPPLSSRRADSSKVVAAHRTEADPTQAAPPRLVPTILWGRYPGLGSATNGYAGASLPPRSERSSTPSLPTPAAG